MREALPQLDPHRGDDARRLFLAALTSGGGISLLFFIRAWLRGPLPTLPTAAILLGWSLTAHVIVALLVALSIFGITALRRLFQYESWKLDPLAPLFGKGVWRASLGFGALALIALLLPPPPFQRPALVLIAALTFAGAWRVQTPRPTRHPWTWTLLLAPILAMNFFLAFQGGASSIQGGRKGEPAASPLLDRQAERDPAVLLLKDCLDR